MSIIESIRNSDPQTHLNENITIGIVVDTNDPQQMGRIRVQCPAWGDLGDKPITDIPFALYASPFAGQVNFFNRGPSKTGGSGTVSYGMWAIPKVGSQVIIACIDGNPENRVWLGCIYGQFLTNTLPHGRYIPDGPLTSQETKIEPLHTNQSTAFGYNTPEWQTRAADAQVSSLTERALKYSASSKTDLSNRGYTENQIDGRLGNDSQVYSITTPGFHGFSMDDRSENCRIRIRTTKGHQIIFDDTNERIYINTAKGDNWIELDENGNIDIYSSRRISMHAKSDINFTTDQTFRVHAKGIHLYSSDEMRVQSAGDYHLKVGGNYRANTTGETYIQSGSTLFIKTDGNVLAESAKDFNIVTDGALYLTSQQSFNILSEACAGFITGVPTVHVNGVPASPGMPSQPANEKQSFWTNRVPEHESWPRGMKVGTDGSENNKHADQFSSGDSNVGLKELGDTISRGNNWRR